MSDGGSRAAIVTWVAAIFVPPGIAAATWHSYLVAHPWYSFLIWIGYEGVLALIKVIGEFVGELKLRWLNRGVDRTDRAINQLFSRFPEQYRDYVRKQLRFLDVKGLGVIGPRTPELDEVYVDVSLAQRAPHQVPNDVLACVPKTVTDRHPVWDYLDGPKPQVLAVLGAPGSGKTTLLQHTARRICESPRGRRRTVPILIYLRHHADTIADEPNIDLPEVVRRTLGRHRQGEPGGWFDRQLADGGCVVLLDGLDEVARQDHRRAISRWIGAQVGQYSDNDFVITSRPQGYRSAPIDGAIVLQIRPFTDEQISHFVHGWYLAVERHSTNTDDEDTRLRAKSAADDLLERLYRAPKLYDLAINPLLLTMMANVHLYRNALPGSRVQLYGEICQVMLSKRQDAKNLPLLLDGEKKEVVLRHVAYAMMIDRTRDIRKPDLLPLLGQVLERVAPRVPIEDFLTDVLSNGLLLERENDIYSFAHQTFQEYLAAEYLRENGHAEIEPEMVEEPWWQETMLLYAARSNADPVIKLCLESRTIAALALAVECADQGSEMAPQLRVDVDGALMGGTDDQELTQWIAGVAITRFLRQPSIDVGEVRIYPQPVTAELYRLFARRCDQSGPDPVLGVWGSDAMKFAAWASNLTGGAFRCRLPRDTELTDPAVHRILSERSLSIWVESKFDRRGPILWTQSPTEHPHRVTGAEIAEYAMRDAKDSAEQRLAASAIFWDDNFMVVPQLLASELISATDMIHAKFNQVGRIRALADQLVDAATPIFTRRRAVTQGGARRIRMDAMRLADHASDGGVETTARTFRRIVAGVTLLQMWQEGRRPRVETIILAAAE